MEPIAEENNEQQQPATEAEPAPTAGSTAPTPAVEGIPAKFMKDGQVDVTALARAYSELEKRQGSQPGAGTQGSGRIDKSEAVETTEGQPAAPSSAIPGVTQDRVEAFTAELTKDGKLSEGSYAELAKLGYSKAVVDAYVDGVTAPAKTQAAIQEAQDAANVRAEILDQIGGEAVLADMINFAKTNLSPEDQAAYNEAVFSRDAARVKLAVQGLYNRYTREVGTQPALHLGGRPSLDVGGYAPFANNEAVVEAMSSPKYQTDPKYRAEVAARLAVSDVFAQSKDVTGQRGR